MYVLSNVGPAVKDPFVIYLNLGFTMENLFGQTLESQNFTMGPRVGLSFGQSNLAGGDTTLFYDVIANFRYTPGNSEQTFRPYLEGGPGVGNYTGAAVHVDVGAGLDIFFDHNDTFGISAHYNEYFTADIERSVTYLASLSHHW